MDKPEIIDDYKWIAIHTYSGYENKVAENILKVADGRGMRDQILETSVPKQTVVVTKVKKQKVKDENGKTQKDSDGNPIVQEIRETEEKVVVKYPSYVFVKVGVVMEHREDQPEEMKLTDVAWYIIRNTRGVTGFVGPNKKPSALSQEDVEMFGLENEVETKVYEIDYKVGDRVDIVSGNFTGSDGTVEDIDTENNKVKVLIPMFMGSPTSVELTLDCVVLKED